MRALYIVLAVSIVSSCSSTPRVENMPRVGILDIKGDLDVGSGNRRLTATSSAGKLGLEEEVAFQPRISLDWDNLHISLTATGVEYTATGEAKAALNIGELKVAGNIPVRSDLEARYIATEFIYDIPPITIMDLGVGIGLGTASYDVTLAEKIVGTRLSADDILFFGYLAARIAKDIGRFKFLLHLSGLTLEPKDWELRFWDIDFNASYRVFGKKDKTEGRFLLGYRYLKLDYEFKDEDFRIEVDATLLGPFVGFVLSF